MTSRSLHKDDIIIVSHPAHNHSLLLALAGPLRNANTHVEVLSQQHCTQTLLNAVVKAFVMVVILTQHFFNLNILNLICQFLFLL